MKPRGSKFGNAQAGPDEARAIFLQMGYAYANQPLATPEWLNSSDTPRVIAQASCGEFKVVFCPLQSYTPYQIDRILRYYSKSYPYALIILSRSAAGQWLIALSSQDERVSNRSALLVDFTNLTKQASNKIADLAYEDESALDLHGRLAKCLGPNYFLKPSAREDRVTQLNRDECRDSFAWWMGIVSSYSILSRHEEELLARRVRDGDQSALFDLVQANLRLVVWMAKKYSWTEIPLSDLVQEGNIGLIKAAQDYDLSKGHRFSTYATQWIRQHIGRAVENQMRIIRIPSHAIESLGKIERTREKLEILGSLEPTLDDIAFDLGMDRAKVEVLIESDTAQPISLDTIVGDSATSIGDFLAIPNQETPEGRLMEDATHNELENSLSKLSRSERSVMDLRFGLSDPFGRPMTLEQVGNEIGFSRERARQIEAQALAKLRKDNCLWSTLVGEEHSPLRLPTSQTTPGSGLVPDPHHDADPSIRESSLTPSIVHALCNKFGSDARLSDITNLSVEDLSNLPSVGPGKIRDIVAILARYGMKLRTQTRQISVDSLASTGQRQIGPTPKDTLYENFEAQPMKSEYTIDSPAQAVQLSLPIAIQTLRESAAIETNCASCGAWVLLKPSFRASWYRCRKCGDSRFVSN